MFENPFLKHFPDKTFIQICTCSSWG